jgi:hypothetical protein
MGYNFKIKKSQSGVEMKFGDLKKRGTGQRCLQHFSILILAL